MPGSRPGITGEDPMSRDTGDQEQWCFPALGNGLTELEKRLVMAKVMRTAVLTIFKTHTYHFGEKYYLQEEGGPIGLRSTCSIARLVMLWWDDQLVVALESRNIKMISGARFMDDARVWLQAIRMGWRLVGGVLTYRRAWMEEERKSGMSVLQKTTEILKDIMNSICNWLTLTMENEEMFGGTLPTLDLQLWVRREDNKVLFSYYEKPMIPNTVLHARSAIPESIRRSTLNQELIRRMVNTSELGKESMRLEIVDRYAQKLINSEYTLKHTQGFIIGGLKGYERLLSLSRDLSNPRWKPLHMTAGWNAKNRRVAKQLAKGSWYKGKTEVDPPSNQREGSQEGSSQQGGDKDTFREEETTSHQGDHPGQAVPPVREYDAQEERERERGLFS